MFMQALGSPKSCEQYKYQLDMFMKWNKIPKENYDDLLKADEKSIQ